MDSRPGHDLFRMLRSGATEIVDLVLPPSCPRCAEPLARSGALCATCWSQLTLIADPVCAVLGTPLPFACEPGTVSLEALADPPPFGRARAGVLYDAVARDLVTSLKYRDRTDLVPLMARVMDAAGAALLSDADLIVPVPLSYRRLVARRFNQAALLAEALARTKEHRLEPGLLRRRWHARPQVGLTRTGRARNVRGAFHVPREHRRNLQGRRALLIDDVYTTGATARAASRALIAAGAAGVDVLTFARVGRD